ncbi:MAG: hypothetical protein Q9211_000704 [Gyalolechia sp. 1 TL-2023]
MDDKSIARVAEKKDKLDAQVKSVDMTEEMQQQAIEVASDAMEKYTIEKDIAQYIKKEVRTPGTSTTNRYDFKAARRLTCSLQFDSRAGATWHCIVGRNFGSFVTHETKHFIYFYLGHCAILLFKTQ